MKVDSLHYEIHQQLKKDMIMINIHQKAQSLYLNILKGGSRQRVRAWVSNFSTMWKTTFSGLVCATAALTLVTHNAKYLYAGVYTNPMYKLPTG